MAIHNPKGILLGGSAVAASFTGVAFVETVIATISIPGGTIGINDLLNIQAQFSAPIGNASSVVGRVRLGGLAGAEYASLTILSGQSSAQCFRSIMTRGALNTQAGHGLNINAGTITGVAGLTSAINLSDTQTLVITGFLLNAADSIAVQMYSAELLKG